MCARSSSRCVCVCVRTCCWLDRRQSFFHRIKSVGQADSKNTENNVSFPDNFRRRDQAHNGQATFGYDDVSSHTAQYNPSYISTSSCNSQDKTSVFSFKLTLSCVCLQFIQVTMSLWRRSLYITLISLYCRLTQCTSHSTLSSHSISSRAFNLVSDKEYVITVN